MYALDQDVAYLTWELDVVNGIRDAIRARPARSAHDEAALEALTVRRDALVDALVALHGSPARYLGLA